MCDWARYQPDWVRYRNLFGSDIIEIGSDIKLIGSNIVIGSGMIEELPKEGSGTSQFSPLRRKKDLKRVYQYITYRVQYQNHTDFLKYLEKKTPYHTFIVCTESQNINSRFYFFLMCQMLFC